MIRSVVATVLACAIASTNGSAQCTVTQYGQGCNSVVATGSSEPNGNTHRVTFTMSGATPGASILFLVGGSEANIPIFDTGCSLLLVPVFAQVHTVGHDGTYTFSKALPSDFSGRARVQFIEARIDDGDLFVAATNGLLLECAP